MVHALHVKHVSEVSIVNYGLYSLTYVHLFSLACVFMFMSCLKCTLIA